MLFGSGRTRRNFSVEGAEVAAPSTDFLAQNRPVPMETQGFLNKKGTNSPEGLMERVQQIAPRVRLFRPER